VILVVNSRHAARMLGSAVIWAMIWSAVVPSPSSWPQNRVCHAACRLPPAAMPPAAWPEPDPQIAAAIAAKYRGKRPRPVAVLIRDRLGQ
jgi:hypothetical protein